MNITKLQIELFYKYIGMNFAKRQFPADNDFVQEIAHDSLLHNSDFDLSTYNEYQVSRFLWVRAELVVKAYFGERKREIERRNKDHLFYEYNFYRSLDLEERYDFEKILSMFCTKEIQQTISNMLAGIPITFANKRHTANLTRQALKEIEHYWHCV